MSDQTFKEEIISQIPALHLLMQLGYQFLTPEEALHLRGGKEGNVILTDVLRDWLKQHNTIYYKGQQVAFTDSNISLAIQKLTDEPYDGLYRSNETLYELLTLGTSLTQTINDDNKSPSLHYIDWRHPENNVYHVTDEYSVLRRNSQTTRRPDIVLFVNGIPLVVIECKRPDKNSADGSSVWEAASQMLRNQQDDEIPHLFIYSQLLLAINTNDAYYATTRTIRKFWSLWREEQAETHKADIHRAINIKLTAAEKKHLYSHRDYAYLIRRHFDAIEAAGERLPTPQDRTLYYLLRPARLLELAHQYIVFDDGTKKIARYQQYFAVQATIQKVLKLHDGRRAGGVIWHTTGSGKSLTMVMLAKVLALHPSITNPKVILVTDRINLDTQLANTFRACGKTIGQAKSGKDLIKLVQDDKTDIIASVINKFETVAKEKVTDSNPNIFVLVDESHRSQYGLTHAQMRRVYPNACYIGFTGTPLTQKEKSTAAKFGDFIHKYPMRQAVEDQAVVPLLYEGRMVELEPQQAAIDRWFERVTRDLSEEQRRDLKRKFSRQGEVSQADQRIQQIAYDISEHFDKNVDDGFKAQLAVPSKRVALKYKQYLDEFEMVSSAVVISAPDTREGNDSADEDDIPELHRFWKKMMQQYGSEKRYNEQIKESFGKADGIQMLIVVDKLLTGFDEPRNTYLYLDKPLKEHGLLQAIARVNRLFEGKSHGYIIDYRGVLGHLNEAINTYDALAEFDSEDVEGTLTDIGKVIDELPQLHADLLGIFKTVANKLDLEALQRFLEPEDVRQTFYGALTAFANALKIAFSSVQFFEDTSEATIARYKKDLTFYYNLRNSVKNRYAETVRYGEYEKKIRKLMDQHIHAGDVVTLVEEVNIFDVEAFGAVVEQVQGAAAKADTIASRMKRTIDLRMEEDPSFYKSFGKLIEETVEAYKQGRIDDAEYLEQMSQHYQNFAAGRRDDTPPILRAHKHAAAYYGIVQKVIAQHAPDELDAIELSANIAIRIEEIIEARKIRDWVRNSDVQNDMRNDLEDYLYSIKGRHAVGYNGDDIDVLMDQLIETAKHRDNL